MLDWLQFLGAMNSLHNSSPQSNAHSSLLDQGDPASDSLA